MFVHSQPSDEPWAAIDRLHIFLASAVDMYAHLGIRDHPIWGVHITLDMKCQVFLAFRSSDDDVRFPKV